MAVRRRQGLIADLAQQLISPRLYAATRRNVLRLEAEAEAAKARMSYAGAQRVRELKVARESAPQRDSSPDQLERVLVAGALLQVTSGWFLRSLVTLVLCLVLLVVAALVFSGVLWAIGAPQRSVYDLVRDVLLDITLFFRHLYFAVF